MGRMPRDFSFKDQIESNRQKLVKLCAAIEREAQMVASNHSSLVNSEPIKDQVITPVFRQARVLLIDDSKFARGIVKGFLEGAGHLVEEASTGCEGLERFALSRPNLVITDIVMKEMGGLDVLDRILELDPAARVLIASSNLQMLTLKEALKRGAVGLLIKPINGVRLNQIVAGVMEVDSGLAS
jgi:two-component system chemotaxis response regulator CheY